MRCKLFHSSSCALSRGSSSGWSVPFASSMLPFLFSLMLLISACSPLSPSLRTAFAEEPETSPLTDLVIQRFRSLEANDGEAEPEAAPSAGEGSDSDPVQPGEDAPEGDADEPSRVVVVDDETPVRELDPAAPQVVLYLGLGLCVGALLGVVYSIGVSTWTTGGVTKDE